MGGCNQNRPRGGWLLRDLLVATGERNRQKGQRSAR
jgi:hypothetical protein